MITFEAFSEKIRKGIAEYYGESYQVEIHKIRKNNGMIYPGLTIGNENSNLSPTIYLQPMYEQYKEGKPFCEIIQEVIRIYGESKIEGRVDLRFFTDFSQVRERVACKLINYETNKELLSSVPHVRFLDLALVCYYRILHDMLGSATILVRFVNMNLWGISEEQLFALAKENTRRMSAPRIESVDQIMESMAGTQTVVHREEQQSQMYVLMNERKLFGAAAICFPDVLQQFSEQMKTNFYLLPSSVHEVILLPEGIESPEELRRLVCNMNRTQVRPEEILSDSVYYYDREREKLTIL